MVGEEGQGTVHIDSCPLDASMRAWVAGDGDNHHGNLPQPLDILIMTIILRPVTSTCSVEPWVNMLPKGKGYDKWV